MCEVSRLKACSEPGAVGKELSVAVTEQQGKVVHRPELSRARAVLVVLRELRVSPLLSACSGTASVLLPSPLLLEQRCEHQPPSWHLDFLAFCLNWLQMPGFIVLRMHRLCQQLFPSHL